MSAGGFFECGFGFERSFFMTLVPVSDGRLGRGRVCCAGSTRGTLYYFCAPVGMGSAARTISTRRLEARPVVVSFVAVGRVSP